MSETTVRRCPHCGERRIERFDTLNGRLVDVTPPCRCPTGRRLAGICRHCDRPVTGKPKVAAYCDLHRYVARWRVEKRNRRKYGAEYQRRYRERHREKLRRKASEWYRNDPEKRRRQNDYNRRYRQQHPERVRAWKRKEVETGKTAAAMRRYRERVKAGLHVPEPAPRNALGERLCCVPACQNVVMGRAKKCEACKRRARMMADLPAGRR